MRNTFVSIATVHFKLGAAVGKTERTLLKMELGNKTVSQFSLWLKQEGFSDSVVKIFEGILC